jgi:hypothetical protein
MPSESTQPRAWLDENHVPCFRADVTLKEASELQDMLGEAFNAGVVSGYEQAKVSELRNAG